MLGITYSPFVFFFLFSLMLFIAYLMLWWGVKKLMRQPWEKASSTSILIFCVTLSGVQEQILFIHLMDIVYIRRAGRQDRMCIRGSRWFNTWRCYSVVEFYCSRQRNILFVVPLMELSQFSLFLWSLVLFRFPSNYVRDSAHAAVSTLFCLTTTGYLC